MENQQLASILANLTRNNKMLLKSVLEPMLDEMAFSEPNKVFLRHGGVVGQFVEYEKALTLLKKLEIIKDYKNMRAGKPVENGTVHVTDKYEITYQEETLLEFARLLNIEDGYASEIKPQQEHTSTEHIVASKPVPQPAKKIVLHPLQLKHYSARKGVLTLNATTELAIAVKGKTIRKNGKPYLQCKLMATLFRSVKNLNSGIFFSTFIGVNDHLINKKLEKKIRNTVAEINKKVTDVGGPNNLIKIQNKKVFVNNSYL